MSKRYGKAIQAPDNRYGVSEEITGTVLQPFSAEKANEICNVLAYKKGSALVSLYDTDIQHYANGCLYYKGTTSPDAKYLICSASYLRSSTSNHHLYEYYIEYLITDNDVTLIRSLRTLYYFETQLTTITDPLRDYALITTFTKAAVSGEVMPAFFDTNGTYAGHLYEPITIQVSSNTMLKSITENGDYFAASDGVDGYNEVVVDVPQDSSTLGPLTVNANGHFYAIDDNFDGYSDVDVRVEPDLENMTFTENGTYTSQNHDGYGRVTVNVPSSGSSPTEFASSGTIASPDSTVSSGSLIAAAFANHKYFELTFDFGGNTYTFPTQIKTNDGSFRAFMNDVSNGVVTIGFIKYSISNLRLSLDSLFFAQVNTDGTGFVDMSAYLPSSTAAAITGYYW